MKPSQLIIGIAVIAISVYMVVPGEAVAASPLDEQTALRQITPDAEGSSLANPAAARQAEILAKASAHKARAYILKFRKAVAGAEIALIEAKQSGNKATVDGAQALYDAALQALDRAVANSAGVSFEKISAMRKSGMGLGEIAQEIGVHPDALGLRPIEQESASEMEMATARNVRTGLSEGHGMKYNGKGMGLDRADTKKGIGKAKDEDQIDMRGDISASLGAGRDTGAPPDNG